MLGIGSLLIFVSPQKNGSEFLYVFMPIAVVLGKFIQILPKKRWKEIANNNGIKIDVSGISALPNYTFINRDNLIYKTFITQEMLKKGILASQSIYVSVAHSQKNLDKYFNELNSIFSIIKKTENNEKKIDDLLNGPIVNSSFKRLN